MIIACLSSWTFNNSSLFWFSADNFTYCISGGNRKSNRTTSFYYHQTYQLTFSLDIYSILSSWMVLLSLSTSPYCSCSHLPQTISFKKLINLATPGLSYCTWDPWCSMWDLVLTKDESQAPSTGSTESYPLDHQGVPSQPVLVIYVSPFFSTPHSSSLHRNPVSGPHSIAFM